MASQQHIVDNINTHWYSDSGPLLQPYVYAMSVVHLSIRNHSSSIT